jgi:ABC-type glycerol-3-phosphate transport system substrate-binding protein
MLLRRQFVRQGVGAAWVMLGLGLNACGRSKASLSCGADTAGEIVLGAEPGAFFLTVPSLTSDFHRFDSRVDIVPWQDAVSVPIGRTQGRAPFLLSSIIGHSPPLLYASLNEPLRALNFASGSLLASATAAFEAQGQAYGVPAVARPLVVAWRKDVFRVAGLSAPKEDWGLNDLLDACEAIGAVVRSQQVPGLQRVMPPMVSAPTATAGAAQSIPGRLQATPSIWAGFVLGFSGTIYSGGAFNLSNPGSLAGLQALVNLARLDGVPNGPLTAKEVNPVNTMESTAIQFVPYPDSATANDPRWAFARFPTLPNPVIPTQYEGIGLDFEHGGGSPSADAQSGDAIAAAASFMVWLLGSGPQGLMRAAGLPPVVADVDVQADFWANAPGRPMFQGDWAHFVDYMQGWPALPDGSFGVTDIVYQALQTAVSDPSSLRDAMNEADSSLKAWLNDKSRPVATSVNTGGSITTPILGAPVLGPTGCP